MDNIFLNAGIIAVVYLLLRFAEMRIVLKESKPLKDLAKDLGIEPNMWYLFITDSELFFRIYSGSCHPMMYRIHGYRSYNGSRKVLLDTYIPNQERRKYEWLYFLFHNLLHLAFILFLFILGFFLSYMVNNKKTRLYNSFLISTILVIIFYRFF
jgi:hypothetical protein